MFLLTGIKLKIGEPEERLSAKALARLGLSSKYWTLTNLMIAHEALDARDNRDIRRVYSLRFLLTRHDGKAVDTDKILSDARKKGVILKSEPEEPIFSETGFTAQETTSSAFVAREFAGARPVVVGFGPCGIFAAYALAAAGLRPIVIERGKPMSERIPDVEKFWEQGVLNENSNVLFGEGGAGTFSDGKLTAGTSDRRKSFVLKTLADAGGGGELCRLAQPHVGTDVLRTVVVNLRRKIEEMGGELMFSTRLTDIVTDGTGVLKAIRIEKIRTDLRGKQTRDCVKSAADSEYNAKCNTEFNTQTETVEIAVSRLILAIGHSARDTYEMLSQHGLPMAQKPFSMGLRIEHSQNLIDESRYGTDFETIYGMNYLAAGLPPAAYKLSHRCADGRGAYSFCMCPGGEIVAAASESGGVFTNGMSNRARGSGMANSALLVDVRTSDFDGDDPLAGVRFQRYFERRAFELGKSQSGRDYIPPHERLHGFFTEDSLFARCLPEFVFRNLREAIPVFGRKITGFDDPSTKICGPETRSSAPVRLLRGDDFQSEIKGIYPCGEGAGYAGGIVSAAVDGLRAAETLIGVRSST